MTLRCANGRPEVEGGSGRRGPSVIERERERRRGGSGGERMVGRWDNGLSGEEKEKEREEGSWAGWKREKRE